LAASVTGTGLRGRNDMARTLSGFEVKASS
jgi:hypothetical protein